MYNVAIIVAAGSGSRMNAGINKMFLELEGKTIIERTVDSFINMPEIDEIIVVCKEEELDKMMSLIDDDSVSFVIGGKTRNESVSNAIETIDECDYVIIHDGARPLITKETILKTLDEAQLYGGAAVGARVTDTIKKINEELEITDTVNRDDLVSIQTPQIFNFKDYIYSLEKAKSEGKDFTDDCQMFENANKSVKVVIGDKSNLKITTHMDLIIAKAIIETRNAK